MHILCACWGYPYEYGVIHRNLDVLFSVNPKNAYSHQICHFLFTHKLQRFTIAAS